APALPGCRPPRRLPVLLELRLRDHGPPARGQRAHGRRERRRPGRPRPRRGLGGRRAREDPALKLPRDGQLIRIFIGEADRWHGRPLYEVIVPGARRRGLAGATVFRGFEGFGARSRVHTTRILRLSEDLPVVIEIVDTEEKVQAFLPALDEMVKEGLVTVEKAT